MKLFDSHAHLGTTDYKDNINQVIENCLNNNIKHVANCSDSLDMFVPTLDLKRKNPALFLCCLGIHPEFALNSDEYIKEAIEFIDKNIDEIDAIGEVGLDSYWDNKEETLKRQKEVFSLMCDIANKYNKPIVVHARNAEEKALRILKDKNVKKIYMHCYEGTIECVNEFLEFNPTTMFGVNGIITFKKADNIRQLFKEIPTNNILLETDSPLLSPVPFRGKQNEPKNVMYVFEELKKLKDENEEDLASILYNSSLRFYGIKE